MITVGDVISLASIWKVGSSLGASLEEIKAALPAIMPQALDIDAQLAKFQSLKSMPQLSRSITLDLSVARDKEPHDISGGQLQAVDITGDLDVRFNQSDSEAYNLNKMRRITVTFDKIFLSNTAQAGKSATLIAGAAGYFQVQDIAPAEINIVASEVTLTISITSSTIMMPIDVQGSYIMIPVDIQAQYMNLAIDIKAQTIGNIKMDIAAQTVGNISVSLAAQTMGNVKMDMAAQSIGNVAVNIAGQISNVTISLAAQTVGISLQGDWAAREGTDKDFDGDVASPTSGWNLVISYSVPANKTLFIYDVSFRYGSDTGRIVISLENDTDTVVLAQTAGDGGGWMSFTKPKVVHASHTVKLWARYYGGAGGALHCSMGGYEKAA